MQVDALIELFSFKKQNRRCTSADVYQQMFINSFFLIANNFSEMDRKLQQLRHKVVGQKRWGQVPSVPTVIDVYMLCYAICYMLITSSWMGQKYCWCENVDSHVLFTDVQRFRMSLSLKMFFLDWLRSSDLGSESSICS